LSHRTQEVRSKKNSAKKTRVQDNDDFRQLEPEPETPPGGKKRTKKAASGQAAKVKVTAAEMTRRKFFTQDRIQEMPDDYVDDEEGSTTWLKQLHHLQVLAP